MYNIFCFSNATLVKKSLTHTTLKPTTFLKSPFLNKQSWIVEIGATKKIVFVLMHFDICIIFNQGAKLIHTCFIIYFMGRLLLVALGVDKLGLNIQTK